MSPGFFKAAVFTIFLLIAAYGVGRLAFILTRRQNVDSVQRAAAPLIGLSALALQLWLYGQVGIGWGRPTLIAPWLVVAVVCRSGLVASCRQDAVALRRFIKAVRGNNDNLTTLLMAAGAVFSLAYLASLILQPLETSDTLVMWALKAKQFFTHQAIFVDAQFIESVAKARYFHVDYPPVLPLIADVAYVLLGRINETAFKTIQFIFLASGAGMMYAFVRAKAPRARAHASGVLFAFLFVALPQFVPMLLNPRYMGYADYPFAVIVLAAVIFLLRAIGHRPNSDWFLALFFAAISAVVKNEGLPFLAIIGGWLGVRYLLILKNEADSRRLAVIMMHGLLAVLVVIPLGLWSLFKMQHHLELDFRVSNLATGLGLQARIRTVLGLIWGYIRTNPTFHWLAAGILAGFAAAIVRRTTHALTVAGVLCLQLASYFVSYVISPYELNFHVLYSIDRLLTQIAPLAVLLLAVAVIYDERQARSTRKTHTAT